MNKTQVWLELLLIVAFSMFLINDISSHNSMWILIDTVIILWCCKTVVDQ